MPRCVSFNRAIPSNGQHGPKCPGFCPCYDFGAEFLRGYGWTELIGLRGPIASEGVAVGFLLLGPGVEYPPHAHEAVEVYLPLSGTAEWMRGKGPYAPIPPGEAIRHPSWMPHAMRTGAEPLVAAYVWRGGDLAAKSRIV